MPTERADATPAPEAGMMIGYARISTDDQKLDLQFDALTNAGVNPDHIYQEMKSGVNTERPELKACLKALRPGDTLVVWRLDRLARSLSDLMKILDDFDHRGIKFKSLNEAIDTSGAIGRLMFHMMGAFAQFERDLISERTKAGLKAALARGHRGGRKPSVDKDMLKGIKKMLKDPTVTHDEVCKAFKISRGALYRALKRERETDEGKELSALLRRRTRAHTRVARQRRLREIEAAENALADGKAAGKVVDFATAKFTKDD